MGWLWACVVKTLCNFPDVMFVICNFSDCVIFRTASFSKRGQLMVYRGKWGINMKIKKIPQRSVLIMSPYNIQIKNSGPSYKCGRFFVCLFVCFFFVCLFVCLFCFVLGVYDLITLAAFPRLSTFRKCEWVLKNCDACTARKCSRRSRHLQQYVFLILG